MKTIQRSLVGLFAALLAIIFVSTSGAAQYQKGDIKLQSIGPLATGPDGVLFVSDPKAACIIAIKTAAKPTDNPSGNFKVEGLNAKVAAVLGASVDQVRIIDLAVDTSFADGLSVGGSRTGSQRQRGRCVRPSQWKDSCFVSQECSARRCETVKRPRRSRNRNKVADAGISGWSPSRTLPSSRAR